MPFDRPQSCRNPLTSSASRARGPFILNEAITGCETKGGELEKEMETLFLRCNTTICGIFSTSYRCSPVDAGVWTIRLFNSVSLSHSSVWRQYGTFLFPKNLHAATLLHLWAPTALWLNDLITKSVVLSVLKRSQVGPPAQLRIFSV